MRVVLLLALMALPLAAAQDEEGRFVERGTWTQFEPEWREGPATVAFGEREADVPYGARYATDGATWFYAAPSPDEPRPGLPESCSDAFPQNGTHVFLTEDGCEFAAHPSVACAKYTATCCDVGAACMPTTTVPGPTPLSQLLDSCGNPAIPAKCTPIPGAFPLLAGLLAAALARRANRVGQSSSSCGTER